MKTGKETYKLVVREDEYIGEQGWCVEQLAEMFDQPSMALDPHLIAHDIVEHVNGIEAIGGVGEELQAMGGIWNTRGRWGTLRRNSMYQRSTEESIGYDIAELGQRFLRGGEDIGCEVPDIDTSYYEAELKAIWHYAKKALRFELDDGFHAYMYLEFKDAFEKLVVLGIKKHIKLYDDRFFANNIFFRIVDVLEDKFKNPQFGEVIDLTIDYDEVEVTAQRYFEYEEEFA